MGKFSGVLLLSDYDQTLAIGGNVSSENAEAIRYFQEQGGLFSLASGRGPDWLTHCKPFFSVNAPAILMNGTILAAPDGHVLETHPLPASAERFAERVRLACPTLDRIYIYEAHSEASLRVPTDRPFSFHDVSDTVYKLIFHTPAENSDENTARITELAGSDYFVSRSWINGIELQRAGTSKGDGVLRVKKHCDKKIDCVVAVGDYENDIAMIQAADIGYAVANALPSVLSAADRVTVSCEEHALAKIISEL